MRHLINAAIILLFGAFPAAAQNESQPEPNVSAETLALYEPGEFKGVQYRLMKPIDFDPGTTYPLILSLHGGSGRGTQNIKNLLIWNEYLADEDLRRRRPAFVLAPQSNGPWLDNTSKVKVYPEPGSFTIDDLPEGMRKFGARIIERIEEAGREDEPVYGVLDEVLELIDTKLSKQYKIDADRVYVLGHSMGGMGTFTAIYQHPDRFAAAIPSAGTFYPWLDARRIQDVPLWIFHGKPDKVVDYMGSRHVFDRLSELNGNAKLTTLPGVGHGSQNSPAFRYTGDDPEKGYITEYASDRCDKTDHVWDWLFRQKRSRQAENAVTQAGQGTAPPDLVEPTHSHVSYGPADRQWLNLYLPSGSERAPVFIYAHHNGSTADDVKASWADPAVAAGIAIVSWESIAKVKSRADGATCVADADVMFAWVKDNAAKYNLDVNNIFIGGQSRGSFVSWRLAYSQKAGIVGIYMGQALPGNTFDDRYLEPINANSPPIFLAYRKEPGVIGDIHDPENGLRVVERYKELGIGDRAELVHSLNGAGNNQVLQFLPQFVESVVNAKRTE